jgi:hypothetical protein
VISHVPLIFQWGVKAASGGLSMKVVVMGMTFFLCSAISVADSIMISGEVHTDVYITTDDAFYYIHYPEDGTVKKMSKRTSAVRYVKIGRPESTERRELLEKFKRTREQKNEAAELTRKRPRMSGRDAAADWRREQAFRELAVFEMQYEHWRGLAEPTRTAISENIQNFSAGGNATDEMVLRQVVREIEIYTEAAEIHESKLESLTEQETSAKLDAYRDIEIKDTQKGEREKIVIERKPPYVGPRGLDYRGDAIEIRRKQATSIKESNVAGISTRIRSVESIYDPSKARERNAISSLDNATESAVTLGHVTRSQSITRNNRFVRQLNQIASLDASLTANYEPVLDTQGLGSWRGPEDQQTEIFEVFSPLWKIECVSEVSTFGSDVKIKVYNADTEQLVKVIYRKDFLLMQGEVLASPGRYFLEIDADYVTYRVKVSEIYPDKA